MYGLDKCQKENYSCPADEIRKNLVYLTNHLSNIDNLLIHLIQLGIISDFEDETIRSENTSVAKINCLLSIIRRKDYQSIRECFLITLRNTKNGHCADKIEGITTKETEYKTSVNLGYKWWPEKKTLPKAFHVRKFKNDPLTVLLKEMISQHKSTQMTVITQKVTVSGLGGIGKTTTAIWFATQYATYYSHIIWIDCGEKSLLDSFQNLARKLGVENRSELDLKHLALESFDILKSVKCLFIFDNAECYIGTEGVKDVLPKFNENFDVLITSRNKDWGDENGDGEVPQFKMDVFEELEGIEFIKENIRNYSPHQLPYIKVLCRLLGNLPLALQIAIATLNRQKYLTLPDYIHRIENTPEILHKKFDNYEKSIDKTMKISLDLIENHESEDERNIGKIAHSILCLFGYITPDDISCEFFMAVERSSNIFDTEEALRLLESYSLLTLKDAIPNVNSTYNSIYSTDLMHKVGPSQNMKLTGERAVKHHYTFSIHRLLQQVIRHNSKESQENILQKILSCYGFLEYKLIPFSFANEKLQMRFPRIKAELIDYLKLDELLRHRRFKEAVELSRIISNTLKDLPSKFNFAVCLKHNSDFKESHDVFHSVLHMIPSPANKLEATLETGFTQWGTIAPNSYFEKDVIVFPCSTKGAVFGQLLTIYLYVKDVENARKVILELRQLILPIVPLNDIITFFHSVPLTNMFLQFHKDFNCITLNVPVNKANENKLELHSWDLDEHTNFPHQLQYLKLTQCRVAVRSNDFIITKNVTLCDVVTIRHPENQKGMIPTLLSEFLDINKIQQLTLENMTISSYSPIETDQLTLTSVSVDEWNKTNWMVNKLYLHYLEFTHKTEMTITELEITHSLVDITILPELLRKLKLIECFLSKIFISVEGNPMPSLLQELSLINVYVEGKHGEQCKPIDISHLISPTLSKLKVTDFPCHCACLQVSLKCLTFTNVIHLENCCMEFLPNIRLFPIELTLNNVRIVNSQNWTTNVTVNHFVRTSRLQLLSLTGMSIDFNIPVDIRELHLIDTKLINWETGLWSIGKLNVHPNPGNTKMEIKDWQFLHDAENVTISDIEIKKEKLLKFLKSISGAKAISGFYILENKSAAIKGIQRIAGVLPGILTTRLPKCAAVVDEWQSFFEKQISDWNNHYLVHIRFSAVAHPLVDILKNRNETSWTDLIKERGERNKLWKKSLDALAPFLQTAGVVQIINPVPYINYNSKFNLWSERGGLQGSLKLFQITKDYLTQHHGLTSLIWNWSLDVVGDMTRLEDYWPGNSYVDVASVHMWNRQELSSTEYQKLLDVVGEKPIAMESMYFVRSTALLARQTRWAWFTIDDEYLTNEEYNTEQSTKRTFNSNFVVNRGNNFFFH